MSGSWRFGQLISLHEYSINEAGSSEDSVEALVANDLELRRCLMLSSKREQRL